ncbi:Phosphoglycolate phosphatase, chromosomal [Anatilimnocola aggregata]|uniref:phosphoglycolate phosphatase n=1 Tax=Anatilimnocola aggregata TaxID=2528021 RepID=A0A517Y6T3_9BACT|nr:HAD family hydrolase [Anatilimnocola aggregata]QDU25926.1 Phosphoglycolate phosphatase, chromosomal [Anatilimnocola aggregata]
MQPRAIFFDFDFTLAESSVATIECANHALVELGLPAVDREAIRRCVAFPLPEVFARLTGIEDPQIGARFCEAYIRRADQVTAQLTTLFPGVEKTLRGLRQSGYRLGIVSTKYRYRIQSILSHLGAHDLVDVIVGGEDVRQHKPAPEPLWRALSRWQLAPDEALYCGDHPVDAQAAEAAEVPFVAVLSGPSLIAEFDGFPRRAVLQSVTQLPAWLGVME